MPNLFGSAPGAHELLMDLHILREQLAEFSPSDWPGMDNALAVTPSSAEECARVMKIAGQANAAIAPFGGGTKQAHGNPIQTQGRPLIALRTTRMNRVVEYEPDDLTITVEAGMTIAELNAIAKPNNQMLPFDVALPGRSTVGGVIATNADGPRRLGYGTVKDLLIGAKVVEASGAISKAGGRTVKNVSGYNMMRLWTGSYGTLAVIVTATFKLIPIPRDTRTLVCSFGDVASAFSLVDAIQASVLNPAAVELVMDEAGVRLLVRAEGTPEQVQRHARDVADMAIQAGALALTDEANWEAINDIPQTLNVADDEVVLKLTLLPSRMRDALSRAQALASQSAIRLRMSARALSGVAYARAQGGGAAHLADGLRESANVIALARGARAQVQNRWGKEPEGLDIMRRIKHEFDPQNALNPGRFVV